VPQINCVAFLPSIWPLCYPSPLFTATVLHDFSQEADHVQVDDLVERVVREIGNRPCVEFVNFYFFVSDEAVKDRSICPSIANFQPFLIFVRNVDANHVEQFMMP
jgi:hypothetical protein